MESRSTPIGDCSVAAGTTKMEASDLHVPLDGTAQIAVELRRRCRNFRNKYHDAYVEDRETPKSMEWEKR